MAGRLTRMPETWFLQCKYCQSIPTRNLHEKELLAMARKLCKNHETNHFLDFVTAELDTLDHATLTPHSMIEILTEIHDETGCTCQTEQIATVEELTRNTHNITIPRAYAVSTTPPKPTTKPGKTLLERLQNGRNGSHKPAN